MTAVKNIVDGIDRGAPAALIRKMQALADDALVAAEALHVVEDSDAAKEAIGRAKKALETLGNQTSNFVGAIEMIKGDEKAIEAAKRIPLCAAERAQEHKRIVW